jgi:hypothetical protein
MARSTKFLQLDARKRLALGTLARHDLYLATVDARGVITLTPAEVTPLAAAPPVRKRAPRKKAAAAAGEIPQEKSDDGQERC